METVCETKDCFNFAYNSKLCSDWLDGLVPHKRGPATDRELMYAKSIGGVDAAITRQRLKKHDQPADALDKTN